MEIKTLSGDKKYVTFYVLRYLDMIISISCVRGNDELYSQNYTLIWKIFWNVISTLLNIALKP